MATVTGYTAEKMQEIIDETVSGAHITGDDLILELYGGGTVNAGNVRGPEGPTGGIEEAPEDGTRYVRKDALWLALLDPDGASVLTLQTRATSSWGDLATVGPQVTVDIGDSGKALVVVTAKAYNDNASGGAHVSYEVSGASTVAADGNKGIQAYSNTSGIQQGSALHLEEGLTPGSNTFTLKYFRDNVGTASFANRHIAVIPF